MTEKFILILLLCIALVSGQSVDPDGWWKSANIYQISPVSFKDSNNDGYGDIQGIISKLDFLVETGVDVIFLSPFYETPFFDFGYDISNYLKVDAKFGTLEDVEELFVKAKEKGLKVILDFVPNHTSDQHEWFIKSEIQERGYENFYVWHDGKGNTDPDYPDPPNNWQSVYGGSSWTWSDKRHAYYYHAFAKEQPDLNLREPRVIDELNNVLDFWLSKGASGFRIDAVSQLFEDPAFLEDPEIANNLPETYEQVEKWRIFLDAYTSLNGGDNRILVPQVWHSSLNDLVSYHESATGDQRAQLPTNFMLINELDENSNASDYKITIDKYLKALPREAIANWFLGTHDHSRVASRMGRERLDGLTLLLLTLPGVAFTYNGDEIGMVDNRDISWDDTKDPWACNANPENYSDISRDPARTPFQWDGSTNAGFNVDSSPWIPIHPDYRIHNLDLQMKANASHFKFYKRLLELRKTETFIDGDFVSKALTANVLGYSRSLNNETFVVLINLGSQNETVNVNDLTVKLEGESEILIASSSSRFNVGDLLNSDSVQLTAFDAVIIKARSDAAKTTLSLLAIVMLIVKLFL